MNSLYIIHYIISNKIHSHIIECVGPETITLKGILENLLNLIEKKRILISLPLILAKFLLLLVIFSSFNCRILFTKLLESWISSNLSCFNNSALGKKSNSSKISDLEKPYGGLGISILSTPKGVMSDQNARKNNVGGEVLCEVF